MTLVDRVDDFGKPAWIAAVVVSFVMCWPIGLLLLGFLIGSGRVMGCWSNQGGDRWQRRMQRGFDRLQRGAERMQHGAERMHEAAERWRERYQPEAPSPFGSRPSSGNHAFDDYRAETLRRLEDEQREFLDFLERLRHAKDKAEFDQFMAERRQYPSGPSAPPPQQ
jgi:hypothetical protein